MQKQQSRNSLEPGFIRQSQPKADAPLAQAFENRNRLVSPLLTE